MNRRQPYTNTERNPEQRKSGFRKLIPFIIIGGMVLFIASKEIPGFRSAIEYYTNPERWQAGESCRNKAISLASSTDFVRLVDWGEIHETSNGYFIENIVVGEMAEQGGEQRFNVDCYADSKGKLVRADRNEKI